MLRRRVNGYDMAYIELGDGSPLVCVHGALGDFRVRSPVLGPLSRRRRVFALSLRHFFPEHWVWDQISRSPSTISPKILSASTMSPAETLSAIGV
jgi:pimeloyl-ACP methyl ester carboxylesterase